MDQDIPLVKGDLHPVKEDAHEPMMLDDHNGDAPLEIKGHANNVDDHPQANGDFQPNGDGVFLCLSIGRPKYGSLLIMNWGH